ncbi:hypothetical protein [Pseudooceanicola nanhaiensis]|uniref:hypothetical protein n=1 Tax=Pseudooceanicola nanhaiensis TaxID=375761 RepID=UPI001666F00F|nr:hypothetical protein [Pseudooceanicola nanhaiensis]
MKTGTLTASCMCSGRYGPNVENVTAVLLCPETWLTFSSATPLAGIVTAAVCRRSSMRAPLMQPI